jgi:predicted RNase H-like HicB family nuclease
MKRNKRRLKIHTYDVIFELLKEGGYSVYFPAIPEICTYGANIKEAKKMARDALLCYLRSVEREMQEFKAQANVRLERVRVNL